MADLPNLLVVDADPSFRAEIEQSLRRVGVAVTVAGETVQACEVLDRNTFDAALVDLELPENGGLELLARLGQASPAPLIVATGHHPGTRQVVEAIHRGAVDVLEKPFSPHRLAHLLLSRNERRQEEEAIKGSIGAAPRPPMVGSGPAWRNVMERVSRVAATPDTTVFIEGESGTGKELVARAIHAEGARRQRPFMAISCAALNENILEAELFGYEKGAFTGAGGDGKPGMLEAAAGGTVFLDEIGEMPLSLQARLLRFLQEQVFKRVGGVQDLNGDVRIIAATPRDLWPEVRKGRVRKDLYFRLNVMPIALPSLRERHEDISELALYFVHRFAASMHKTIKGLSPEAETLLDEHGWPGNVRELRNVCEYAVILCDGEEVEAHHLALQPERPERRPEGGDEMTLPMKSRSLREMEQELIRVVLTEMRFNVTRAARALGINRSTLYNKMREYGLQRESGRELQQSI